MGRDCSPFSTGLGEVLREGGDGFLSAFPPLSAPLGTLQPRCRVGSQAGVSQGQSRGAADPVLFPAVSTS